jgi:uncharacterized membrane protein YkoI
MSSNKTIINKKNYLMAYLTQSHKMAIKSTNSKIVSSILLLLITPTAMVTIEKIASIAYVQEHQANAQLSGRTGTNQTNAFPPLTRYPATTVGITSSPSENWTGSIQTSLTIGQAIASKVHVSIANASTIAEKAIGNGSHTVLAMLETDRGFLVYTIWVVDGNYNFNRVIVDPANGKVLFNQPLTSMELEQSRMILRGMLHPNLNAAPLLPLRPQPFPPFGTSQPPSSGMIIPVPPASSPPMTGTIPNKP